MHLAHGTGPWERARLRGEFREAPGLMDMGLDHSPFGKPILAQLQQFALALTPMPLKVNVRSPRPGQSYQSWLLRLI